MELTPRQVEFSDAALRVLAREGWPPVSFRTVAAEAGMSLGAVQKAFASKNDLLSAMFSRLRRTGYGPIGVEPGRPTLVGWLVELMVSVLPLDEPRRAAELQRASFAERAAFDPAIAAAVAASDHELRMTFAGMVRRAQAEGELAAAVDPDATAWAVRAFIQGMSRQLLYDPVPENSVRRQCQWVVEAIFRS